MNNVRSLRDQVAEKLRAMQGGPEKIALSEENLVKAWEDIGRQLTAAKPVYRSAIMAAKLSFAGQEVKVHAGIVAIEFLKTERHRLLEFFKTYYRDPDINVLFDVVEEATDQGGERVLSSREVYEKMAEKNPLLKQLKENLGFDLEY